MRTYSVGIAALALHAPSKWVDNLISQHNISDVERDDRGYSRRISHEALLRMAVIRALNEELGVSVARALELSSPLLEHGTARVGPLEIALDLQQIRRRVAERLEVALESAPQPRRGRPRGS